MLEHPHRGEEDGRNSFGTDGPLGRATSGPDEWMNLFRIDGDVLHIAWRWAQAHYFTIP